MRSRKRAIGWSIGILVVAVAAFLVVTWPTSFPKVHPPQVVALAKYRHWGCGTSDMSRATTTIFYPNLKATASLQASIHEEMIEKGFAILKQSDAIVYEKSTGGLFPDKSYVVVAVNGTVITGVSHRKWPLF